MKATSGDAGGLMGGDKGSQINYCYSTATVWGHNGTVGGLAARVDGSTISYSYATGNVSGDSPGTAGSAGGLVGTSYTQTVIKHCYATGTVSGKQHQGGLVGTIGDTTVDNTNFWNTDSYAYAFGHTSSGIVGSPTGLTTEQMKSAANFSNKGWDISNTGGSSAIWRIYDGDTYPLLRSFLKSTTITAGSASRVYDGSTTTNVSHTVSPGADGSLIQGTQLVANTAKDVGTYTSSAYTGIYSSQQGYDISFVSDTVVITPAELTVTAADNKVYDGTDAATISGSNFSGLVSGDTVTLAGTFADKNVGNGKTVNYSNSLSGADAGNYVLDIGTGATTADITPAVLTVGGTTTASDKVYNGTTTATVSGGTITGVIAGDTVILDQTGDFSDKKAGTNKTVTYTNSLTGSDAGNYKADVTTGTITANITRAELTIGGTTTAENKVYDGTTDATVSGGTITGIIAGDAVTLSQTGDFDTKNAGTDKTVTYTNTLTGSDAGNYKVDVAGAGGTATASITPATISVTGITASDKVYDGTTNAVLSGGTLTGLIAGDTVTSSQTGDFADKNAGTDKTVTYTTSISGSSAGNYKLDTATGTTTADITAKEITVTGAVAANKTYDGTTVAAITGGSLTGVISGDDVTLLSTGSFDNKNTGTGKTVTYALGGTDGGNYQANTTATADITAAELTIGGTTTAENKVYDGTTTATLSGGTITGIIAGDAVALSQTGDFDTKNAGTDKTVTYTNTLLGSDAGNYVLNAAGGGTTTASITPASLTVTGTCADNKVYDGTTDAVLSGGTLTGLIAGDTVTLSQTGDFADKNAGTDKTVTYTTSISGSGAGNYKLDTATGTTTADISAKEITVTGAVAANKNYDGNTTATITGGSLTGVISGDDVTLLSTGSFDNKNIGNGKTVTYAMDGTDSGNYRIISTTTADILTAMLQVIGADDKVYDGTTDATVSSSNLSGLAAGDDVFLSGTFADKNVGSDIAVTYGTTLLGSDAGNYSLAVSSGSTTADITPKTLTVTGTTAADKVYDGTTDAVLSGGILSGLISGESVTLSQSGCFADKNAGKDKTVAYTCSISGTEAGNYTLESTGTTLADITPKTLTVTGGTAADKTYDGTTEAFVSGGTYSGVIAGDSVRLLQTGTFTSKNAGENKTVRYTNSFAGFDAGNYKPSQTTGTATADITPAIVTITGTTATDKVYDGTTEASLSSQSITGLIAGDSVTLTQSGTFADKNVGNNITVTYTNSLSGASAGNYVLGVAGGTAAADITPAALTVTGTTAADKVYDGTTDVLLSGGTLSGLVAGDNVLLSQTGAFADKNAGQDKTVTCTRSISGTDAGNYILDSVGTTFADITAKTLTVTGGTAADKIYDGTTGATISGGTFSGLIAGDSATLLQTGTFADKNAGTGKTVTYTNSFTGIDGANYVADQATGTSTADITPATLTITANNDGRTAGGSPYQGGNGVVYDGFVNNESTSVLSGALTFGGSSQGASATGRYTIRPNGLLASNYAINYVDGTLTIHSNEPYTAAVMTADQTSGTLRSPSALTIRDKADPDQIAARVSTADNPAGSIQGAYSLTIIDGGLRLPDELAGVKRN